MGGLRFAVWMMVAMAVLTTLLVALTLGLKGLRTAKQFVYKRSYRRIEPALEGYLAGGEEEKADLERLRPWQRNLFLAPLMVERMAVLRGTGRERLVRLAAGLGLVDRYLGELGSRRRWRRARAAENLGYFGGERAVEPLGDLFLDADETVRAVAARALARLGTEEATAILARTLDNPSELTRLRVAENLERIGDFAVRPLSGVLLALKSRGSVMAAQVLGNLRAREARPALIAALLHTWDQDLRAQITLALGKIGDPDDVPLILRGTGSDSWPVRAQAANSLGLIGEVSAIPALKELASDREWWVRLNACKALANMGPFGEQALIEILEGDDPYARDRAAATLEVRGVTRRAACNLTKPGKKGEKAYAIVRAAIRSGSTRYLHDLAGTLPEEEREALETLLEEYAPTITTEEEVAGHATSVPASAYDGAPEEPATGWVRPGGRSS